MSIVQTFIDYVTEQITVDVFHRPIYATEERVVHRGPYGRAREALGHRSWEFFDLDGNLVIRNLRETEAIRLCALGEK